MGNVVKQTYKVTVEERRKQSGHNSFVIWLFGLSGSGKSTIANALEQALFDEGKRTYVLDGDNLRFGINQNLGFSSEDRTENQRRVAEIAKLMVDAGTITIAAFISPLRSDREMVKAIVGKESFFEVFVNTPISECEKRDVKGLYKKARAGVIQNFTGISAVFEKPEGDILTIDTSQIPLNKAVVIIRNALSDHLNKPAFE